MMRLKFIQFLIILAAFISITCSESEVVTRSYPVIETKVVTEITGSGATLNAEVLNVGKTGISDHGFVYSKTPNPTIDNADRITLGESLQKGRFSAFANRNLVTGDTYYVKPYAITTNNNFVVYGREIEFVSLGGDVPEIEDFVPRQGVIGDTIMLIGSAFSNVPNNHEVLFDRINATVIKATPNSLWCLVPEGATPGQNELLLELGPYSVEAELKFLLKTASLSSFSPGSISFGDTVTIKGLNFSKQNNFNEVVILGKLATVISSSSDKLKAIVANNVNISESPISIRIGLQSISFAENIKLLQPLVNSFNPVKGTKDTEITIHGNYFSPIAANNRVVINGKTMSVIQVSKKIIKVKVPAGIEPGSYPLSVTIAGQTTTSVTEFEVE